jgi:hypothetical protein
VKQGGKIMQAGAEIMTNEQMQLIMGLVYDLESSKFKCFKLQLAA